MAVGRVNIGGSGIKKGEILIKKIIREASSRTILYGFFKEFDSDYIIFPVTDGIEIYSIELEALVWSYIKSNTNFHYYDNRLKRFYMAYTYASNNDQIVVINNNGEKILEFNTNVVIQNVVANENCIYVAGRDSSYGYIIKYSIDGKQLWKLQLTSRTSYKEGLVIDKSNNVLFHSNNNLCLVKADTSEYIYQKSINSSNTIFMLDELGRIYTRDYNYGKVNIYNVLDGSFIKSLTFYAETESGYNVVSSQISSDNKLILINTASNGSYIIDIDTNELLQRFPWKCSFNQKIGIGIEQKGHGTRGKDNMLLLFNGGYLK